MRQEYPELLGSSGGQQCPQCGTPKVAMPSTNENFPIIFRAKVQIVSTYLCPNKTDALMKQFTLCLLVAFGVFSSKSAAQTTDTLSRDTTRRPTVFQYFFQEKALDVTLELDFEELLREKEGNSFRPAKFRYTDKTGIAQETLVEIKPKGHSRRTICEIPPIKVKFPEEFLAAHGLQPMATLELVVICKNEYGYEQYVLREYAAYRLYNILTGNSLRVQLLKLKFQQTGEKKPSAEGFAFFTEPEGELAERLGGKVIEPTRISPKGLEPAEFDMLSLFEFMIGNTDWYVYNRHNIATLLVEGDSLLMGVPYDFDYSGFVHTPYALPAERLKIPDVTIRYFLGLCRQPNEWVSTLQLFRDKKPELLGFCEQFSYFNKESRKYTTGYLEDFFELLDDPKKVKDKIVEHCGPMFIK